LSELGEAPPSEADALADAAGEAPTDTPVETPAPRLNDVRNPARGGGAAPSPAHAACSISAAGSGRLIQALLKDRQFERIVGDRYSFDHLDQSVRHSKPVSRAFPIGQRAVQQLDAVAHPLDMRSRLQAEHWRASGRAARHRRDEFRSNCDSFEPAGSTVPTRSRDRARCVAGLAQHLRHALDAQVVQARPGVSTGVSRRGYRPRASA